MAFDRGADVPTPATTVQLAASGAIYCGTAGATGGLHVVYGSAGAPDSVRYFRSTDEGATWSSVATLNGVGTPELDTPVSANGNLAGVVSINAITNWNDGFSRDGGEIALRRSTDGGATWGSATTLTSGAKAFRFSLNVNGSIWNLVWMDYRNGYWDIFQKRSTDSGATWGADVKLVDGNNGLAGNPGGPGRPVLAAEGNDLYMVWMDPRDNRGSCTLGTGEGSINNCTEVYFKYSSDGGATWGSDQRLTTNPTGNYAGRPVVAVKDGNVLVTYDYSVSGDYVHIAQMRSPTKGSAGSWSSQLIVATVRAGSQTHSDVVFGPHAGDAFIFWRATRDGVMHVFAKASNNYGVKWGPERQISVAAAGIPLCTVTANYVHVVYTNSGGGALQYRRLPITP